jgi:hypothetical protein
MSKLPLEDPRNRQILDYLVACGMTMPTSAWHKHPKGQIHVVYGRDYDREDFESAAYLEPRPEVTVAVFTRLNPHGVFEMKTGYMRRFQIGEAGFEVVVSDALKQKLEKAGLKHLQFVPAELHGEGAEQYPDPIWQLSSDLVLPPVSPSCCFTDAEGNSVGDPLKGRTLNEGLYLPTEYHYTRSSLQALGEFDAARVREGMGPHYRHHPLIVSRRFYQFCVQHKLKMDWIPVRIDPE